MADQSTTAGIAADTTASVDAARMGAAGGHSDDIADDRCKSDGHEATNDQTDEHGHGLVGHGASR